MGETAGIRTDISSRMDKSRKEKSSMYVFTPVCETFFLPASVYNTDT